MRRDRVINNLKHISNSEFPSTENMKRLFKSLSDIFQTSHVGDMLEKAELCTRNMETRDDFVKFFYKTKELLVSCLPDEFELQQDLNFRAVFKIIVKIAENFGEMKKELK